MEEKDCWDKFIVSGKVEDYLEYRSIAKCAAYNKTDITDMENSVEGNNYAYGDGFSFIPS